MAQTKKVKPAKTSVKTVSKKATNGYGGLNRLHVLLGFLLAIEAVAIVVLSRTVSVPVVTNYLSTDTLAGQAAGHTVWAPALRHLFDINLAYAVAVCLAVAAIARFWVATKYRLTYEADMKKGIHKARRVEYIIGGGLVLITLALVNGVYDLSTLLAIFAFAAIFGLFLLLTDTVKDVTTKHPRIAHILRFLAALLPWVIVAIYLFGAQAYGDRSLPAYIYWLDGSVFVLTFSIGYARIMQRRGKGKMQDDIYAEKVFMALSFLLVSAFAWQIFFGALR